MKPEWWPGYRDYYEENEPDVEKAQIKAVRELSPANAVAFARSCIHWREIAPTVPETGSGYHKFDFESHYKIDTTDKPEFTLDIVILRDTFISGPDGMSRKEIKKSSVRTIKENEIPLDDATRALIHRIDMQFRAFNNFKEQGAAIDSIDTTDEAYSAMHFRLKIKFAELVSEARSFLQEARIVLFKKAVGLNYGYYPDLNSYIEEKMVEFPERMKQLSAEIRRWIPPPAGPAPSSGGPRQGGPYR